MTETPRSVIEEVCAAATSIHRANNLGVSADAFFVGIENSLQDSLASLLRIVQRLTVEQRQRLTKQNGALLRQTKNVLSKSRNPILRSYHDRIFTKTLGYAVKSPMQVTEIYDAFVRGIFTFDGEVIRERPAYHRERSCGPKRNPDYKATHACKLSNSAEVIKSNKRRIENCYIERQLYDKMHNHYNLVFDARGNSSASQDDGHLDMLRDVRADYESCCPNSIVEVQVFFESRDQASDDVPVQVDITWTTARLSQPSRKVTFVRTLSDDALKLYDDIVYARSWGANGSTLYRTQQYDRPNGAWKKSKAIEFFFESHARATAQASEGMSHSSLSSLAR